MSDKQPYIARLGREEAIRIEATCEWGALAQLARMMPRGSVHGASKGGCIKGKHTEASGTTHHFSVRPL